MNLTLESVKQKGREYYEAGKLTAQHPDESMRECVYETNDGYRCVVGAALSEEQLTEIGQTSHMTCSVDLIGCIHMDATEMPQIRSLQRLHDAWASDAQKYGDDDNRTNQSRRDFLAELMR
ncbi:hypothetical protein IVA80_10870 [Bradyrhizobium sp. 139]|uniref:hypothetical protein n=1 Tax=Bradyrhizobium sp. 139 TaxID=2782616 RepID=UPI001FFB558A|nr:hypothetical protein [Bradyrhizobium sp. 139]MCK1741352.1 hypothetical protein [Bradyrhizobium sp. 139]